MKGFRVLSREREGGAVRGFARQGGALYRFELLADDTLALWRVRAGAVLTGPARAPGTAAMLRRALQGPCEESLEPRPGPR